MTAPTVNAFYSSSLNSINFPAGILQPPFFDPSWDDATNYGGIGAVIGHGMTHGFDDRGRQFDAKGNLTDWWLPEDIARYKERSDKVAAQYSGYTVLDTLHLNGRLTLGENTADLGGVAVAYHALEKALAKKPQGKIGGFYAPAALLPRLRAGVGVPAAAGGGAHAGADESRSPAMWRVNGPLSTCPSSAGVRLQGRRSDGASPPTCGHGSGGTRHWTGEPAAPACPTTGRDAGR